MHPDASQRLDAIETDLHQRIETAREQNWLADVEQLRITLRRLDQKRAQLAPLETPGLEENISVLPAWDVPQVDAAQFSRA